MIVSPVPSAENVVTSPESQPKSMAQKVRALKMSTQATPGTAPAPEMFEEQVQSPEAEVTKPLDPQQASLAKQRRALQVKERELAARARELEAAHGNRIDVSTLKEQPLRVLLENGVTFEQLTEAVLNHQGSNSEVSALKQELKSLKDEVKKTFDDKEVQQRQQVVAQMTREAKELVSTGDEFELIRAENRTPDVIRLIETVFDRTGELLSVREACEEVEQILFDDVMNYTKLNKVRSKFAQPAPEQMPTQNRQMRTLTNRDTATAPMSAKQRALLAFNNQLKRT